MRILLGCLMVGIVGACSSDSDDDSEAGSRDWSSVKVPANLDVESCKDADTTVSGATSPCTTCCRAAGFSQSSTLYKDQCTCGKPKNNDGNTICASQAADAETCGACCQAANFSGRGWVGGSSPQCMCFGASDKTSCASALNAADPSEACAMCCVEHGFVSMAYIGIGEKECRCLGG